MGWNLLSKVLGDKKEPSMWISEETVFQAERKASAKALRWKHGDMFEKQGDHQRGVA